jgi:hypothetical protein
VSKVERSPELRVFKSSVLHDQGGEIDSLEVLVRVYAMLTTLSIR